MIHLKTPEEIEIMAEGGQRLRKVVSALMPMIAPGISTRAIDEKADELIHKQGGEASFKKVPGYHWATCVPVNEQVVHTPPSKRILNNGDVLTVDIGMYYRGFHTDYADTVIVGTNNDPKVNRFLEVGKKTLYKAIDQVTEGAKLGAISKAIEDGVYGNGYKVLKELTGHGIGKELHEDPYVFGFLDKPVAKTITIQKGLVLAIEVIYSVSSETFRYEGKDDWSVVTSDKSLSACFEHTVAVTEQGTVVLT